MNDDLGVAWLEQVFDPATKKKARRNFRLLIFDGHGSHVTQRFMNYCDHRRILVLVYPSHATHTLQPLDVSCFKPLSQSYSNEIIKHNYTTRGRIPIQKAGFISLFWPAWVHTFGVDLILQAFAATGISPVNADVILDRFHHTTPDGSESAASSSTAYSAEDWLKACTTLQAEVKDSRSVGARKLGQTIHHLSSQVELLQTELDNIRQKLYNKNRRQN